MLEYPWRVSHDAVDGQRALTDRFCNAMSARDLDAAMECLWDSPDLVNVLSGNVLRGGQATRSSIQQLFDAHSSVRLVVNECSYVQAGDAIIAVGTATYELGGEVLVERWTDVRRRIDGRWRIVLNHATVVEREVA